MKIEKWLNYGLWMALAVYWMVFSWRTVHWIGNPFANEAFEWGSIDMMHCFIKGINPYSFDNFLEHAYAYGPLYSFVCSLFYPLANGSVDSVVFCRLMTLFMTIGSAFFVASIVLCKTGRNVLLTVIAFTITFVTSFQTAPVTAFPPALAVLFISYICWSFSRSWGLNYSNLLVVAILSVLSFFVKSYFIMIIAPVGLYLLAIRQWKKALFYAFAILLLGCVAVLTANYIAPALLYIMVGTHAAVAGFIISHLLKQWGVFFVFYFPLLLALAIILYNRKREAFQLVPPFYWIFIVVSALCLCMIGGHTGAFMEYFWHLLLLPVTIAGTIAFHYMPRKYRILLFPLLIWCSVYHLAFIQSCPAYRNEMVEASVEKLKKYDAIKMDNSYNLAQPIDDFGYKHRMKELGYGHRGHVMHMLEVKESFLFHNVHMEAVKRMKAWKAKFESDMANGIPDYVTNVENPDLVNLFTSLHIEHLYEPVDTVLIPVGRKTTYPVVFYKSKK